MFPGPKEIATTKVFALKGSNAVVKPSLKVLVTIYTGRQPYKHNNIPLKITENSR